MRILIIRLSSIGDILLTTPVLSAWKEKYPESTMDVLVMKNFGEVLEGNPSIDNLLFFDKEKTKSLGELIRFAGNLRKNGYDCVFDLHGKLRSRLIVKLLGVKAFTYRKRRFWKTVLVALRLSRYRPDDTIVRNYFGAFRDFGLCYRGEQLRFYFSDQDLAGVAPWAGHPAMSRGASKNTKKWPLDYFTELAQLLYERFGKEILILGGREDAQEAALIEKKSGGRCINLAGKLSLKESGALLSRSLFLVCNDSAPFHLARAAGIPTFVFFGPTSPRMFDLNEKDTLLYAGESCSPCSLHGEKACPRGHFHCMRHITPQQALEAIGTKVDTMDTRGRT